MQYLTKQALYQKIEEIRPRLPCIPKALDDYQVQLKQLYPNLSVVRKALDSKKVSGMLLRNGNALILLNDSRTEISQRFTLTHEMVHYFLHSEVLQFFCEEDGDSPYEWQANEGAAELLVPYRTFLPLVSRIRPLLQINREGAYSQLAKQFAVSPTVISNRMQSLSFELNQYCNGVALDRIELLSSRKIPSNQKSPLCSRDTGAVALDIFPE